MPPRRVATTVATRERELKLLLASILGIVLVLYLVGAITVVHVDNGKTICSDEQTTTFIRSLLAQYFITLNANGCEAARET